MQVTKIAAECVQMMNIRKMAIDLYGINFKLRISILDKFYETDYDNEHYIGPNNQLEENSIEAKDIFKYMDDLSDDKLIPNWLSFILDLHFIGLKLRNMDDLTNIGTVDVIFPSLGPKLNFDKLREIFYISNKNDNYSDIILTRLGELREDADLNTQFIIRNMNLESTKFMYDLMLNTVYMTNESLIARNEYPSDNLMTNIIEYFPREIGNKIFKFNTDNRSKPRGKPRSKPWLTLNLDEIDNISESAAFYFLIMLSIENAGGVSDIGEFYDYVANFNNIINYDSN